MVGVMKIMATSFKRTCAHTVVFSAPDPAADHVDPHLHRRCLDTHRQVWLSLLWGHGDTVPFSCCTQGIVCALQKSVSPVLWKFCNHITLASKVKFPGGFQSLCWIPRLGNLLWVLELS